MHMPAYLRHANVCACSFHWILLDIKVEEGKVELLDSLTKEDKDYTIVKGIVNREFQSLLTISRPIISSSFPDMSYLTPLLIFFAGGQGLGKVHQGDSRQLGKKVVLASTKGK